MKQIMLFFLIIGLISFTLETQSFTNMKKCGVNSMKIPPIKNNLAVVPSPSSEFRRLQGVDGQGFKDFNLYLDLTNLEQEMQQYNIQRLHDLFINALNRVKNTLQTLLRVKACIQNYNFYDQDIQSMGIKNWDRSKFGNQALQKGVGLQNLGIDLVIFARFGTQNEMQMALASATPTLFDEQINGRPVVGLVNLNKDIDYSLDKSREYLEAIIIHEFTHVLGFHPFIFSTFTKNYYTERDNYGGYHFYVNSPKVLEVARRYYNCNNIKGVELENDGQMGTVGSHWEARILLGEYMNGVVHPEEQAISEFTLALLEDTGYFKPNYYTGGLMKFGKNKGCEFLTGDCINPQTKKTNSKWKNEFFDNIHYTESKADPSCSSGRQSRTYNYMTFEYAKNCPIAFEVFGEENKYYVGHCGTKGSGGYGKFIYYKDNNGKYTTYTASALAQATGEVNSQNSFCALSSLSKFTAYNYQIYSKVVRAVCYQMHCSDRSLTIQMGYDFVVCPRAGGKINAIGYDGYLLCPDYNLICSATVLCNDMFDCVDKKSTIKEGSYNYDYESKTNQDIGDAEREGFSQDNYELSQNGKCPQYCVQCNEQGQCMKCKDGFQIDQNKKCSNNAAFIVGTYKSEPRESEKVIEIDKNFKQIGIVENETKQYLIKGGNEKALDGKKSILFAKYVWVGLSCLVTIAVIIVIGLKMNRKGKDEFDEMTDDMVFNEMEHPQSILS